MDRPRVRRALRADRRAAGASEHLYAAEDGARQVAEQLIRDAGYDPVFVGGLEAARMLEDALQLFSAIRRAGFGPYYRRFAEPGAL
jgi:predicted dinucleotide-binding enzyme